MRSFGMLRCLVVSSTAILAVAALAPLTLASVTFTEISQQVGIDVIHDPLGFNTATGAQQDFYGPGLAWSDVNGDGWLDLAVGNGEEGNFLFLNNGPPFWTFTEVAQQMGVRESRVTNGVALADIDNDGLPEMAMGNWFSEPQFYLGRGTTFVEQSEQYGLYPLLFPENETPPDWTGPESMAVTFGDFNCDGFADLYVANYRLMPDILLRSDGGGYFVRTDKVSTTETGYGFQAVFWDYDNDHDQDIYVANDFGFNFLFRNEGPGGYNFTEIARDVKISGPDGGGSEIETASMAMGLAIGDYDNDLDLDVYVTNYGENALWQNPGSFEPGQRFTNVVQSAGLSFPLNCWGADWVDLDNDADLDMVMTGGWILASPLIAQPREIPNRVWLNNGGPNWDFEDISTAAGFEETSMGRGLATADFDRDGDVDVAISNNSYYEDATNPQAGFTPGPVLLYETEAANSGHWVNLELRGAGAQKAGGCNRDGIGARIWLTAGGVTQMREIQAGSSYLSMNSLEAEFGLGDVDTIDEVRVRWACGDEEVFAGVKADRFYTLMQDQGAVQRFVMVTGLLAGRTADGVRVSWAPFTGSESLPVSLERAVDDGGSLQFEPLSVEIRRRGGSASASDPGAQAATRYAYRVVLEADDGSMHPSIPVFLPASGGDVSFPREPVLGPNFPNPFNPNTVILFELPRAMQATLKIYDPQGRLVRTLAQGLTAAGSHRIEWDGRDQSGRDMASGVYFYTLFTEEGSESRRMTLLK